MRKIAIVLIILLGVLSYFLYPQWIRVPKNHIGFLYRVGEEDSLVQLEPNSSTLLWRNLLPWEEKTVWKFFPQTIQIKSNLELHLPYANIFRSFDNFDVKLFYRIPVPIDIGLLKSTDFEIQRYESVQKELLDAILLEKAMSLLKNPELDSKAFQSTLIESISALYPDAFIRILQFPSLSLYHTMVEGFLEKNKNKIDVVLLDDVTQRNIFHRKRDFLQEYLDFLTNNHLSQLNKNDLMKLQQQMLAYLMNKKIPGMDIPYEEDTLEAMSSAPKPELAKEVQKAGLSTPEGIEPAIKNKK